MGCASHLNYSGDHTGVWGNVAKEAHKLPRLDIDEAHGGAVAGGGVSGVARGGRPEGIATTDKFQTVAVRALE